LIYSLINLELSTYFSQNTPNFTNKSESLHNGVVMVDDRNSEQVGVAEKRKHTTMQSIEIQKRVY
jgi:hypothetical protein